jgi:hypothetical protein
MRKKALLSAVTTLLLLLLGELVLRLLGYVPPLMEETEQGHSGVSLTGYFWVADRTLGFRNRPHGRFVNFKIVGKPLVTTDPLGYRNGLGWSTKPGAPVVAFIGDSTTFCAEVADDRTGPSEVARLLTGKVRARVLNAGVRGYNTVQAKRSLEQVLSRFPETRVVVYTYAQNDYLENLNPIVYHPARAPTIWRDASGRWVEREVDSPVAPPGESFVSAEAVRTAGRQKESPRVWLTNRLRARSVLVDRLLALLRKAMGESRTSRGILELSDGSLGPLAGGTAEWKSQREWAREHGAGEGLEDLLARMNETCRKRGVKFLATEFNLGEGTGEFAEHCRRAGVACLDLRASFPRPPLSYAARTAQGYDGHYGAEGTRAFARAVAPRVEAALSQAGVGR